MSFQPTLGDSFIRQRRNSAGDNNHVIPTVHRPVSAHEIRAAFPYNIVYPITAINAMFRMLRLDPIIHKSMEWIVKDCLQTLEKEGWLLRFEGQETFLYDEYSQEVKDTVPTLEHYREFALKLVEVHAENAKKRGDAYHKLQDIIYSAIMQANDVNQVLSPEVLDSILRLLDVDSFTEPYLIPRIRQSIEELWIHHSSTNQESNPYVGPSGREFLDVDNLLTQLAEDRIQFLRRISPTGVLICVECESNLVDVSCLTCKDCMCNTCFSQTHATGARALHPALLVEQIVCSECEGIAATVRCRACVDCFCTACFAAVHQKGKRLKHGVSLTEHLVCTECSSSTATILCKECNDVFCLSCFQTVHRAGGRQAHEPIALSSTIAAQKLLAGNMDVLIQTYEKSLKSQFILTPWYKFYDHLSKPYWYNFHTKETIFSSTLPSEKWTQEMSDLLVARCAQNAAQGAVFVVAPSSLAIKKQLDNKEVQQNDIDDGLNGLYGASNYMKEDHLRPFDIHEAIKELKMPSGPLGVVTSPKSNRPSSANGAKLQTLI